MADGLTGLKSIPGSAGRWIGIGGICCIWLPALGGAAKTAGLKASNAQGKNLFFNMVTFKNV